MAARSKSSATDDDFRRLVTESLSVAQLIGELGLVPAGGNYKTVQARVKRLGLDTSHFTGSGWNVGARYRPFSKTAEVQDLLVENSAYQSFKLKNRLLKAGLMQKVRASCGLTQWLGRPIPLELDHVNGVNDDNRVENLRLLCPNCHALTDTYRGKNQQRAGVVK